MLSDVVAVNILGRGYEETLSFWPEDSHYKRHYVLEDQAISQTSKESTRHKLEGIQIIQYSLASVVPGKIEDKDERAWLDFFQNAHHYDTIPENIPEEMKLAYERIRPDNIPPNIRDLYETEENYYNNYSEKFITEGINKGMKVKENQVALKMIEDGMSDDQICRLTGMSHDQIQALRQQKHN